MELYSTKDTELIPQSIYPPAQGPRNSSPVPAPVDIPPIQETPKKMSFALRQLQPHNKPGLQENTVSPPYTQRRRIFTRQSKNTSDK